MMAEPRIHEFETNPHTIYRQTEDVVETEWRSKISVDLNFVSICSPSTTGRCQITIAGLNASFAINCPYDKFMALWRGEHRR